MNIVLLIPLLEPRVRLTTAIHIDLRAIRSRHPFVPAAGKLINELSKLSIQAAQWINYKWDVKYCEDQLELRLFVSRPNT